MTRLLDIGIEKIGNVIADMAKISENCIMNAIESYENGIENKEQIYEWSEKLRSMQDEVSDIAVELIARYQPVATDLRYIRSCNEISYVYSRFGRYSLDIVDTIYLLGNLNGCDKSVVREMSKTVRNMILLSINALKTRDKTAVEKLYEMDDTVDLIYRKYLRDISGMEQRSMNERMGINVHCYISTALILKFLERISDHACYVGDSVNYFVTGSSKPRH